MKFSKNSTMKKTKKQKIRPMLTLRIMLNQTGTWRQQTWRRKRSLKFGTFWRPKSKKKSMWRPKIKPNLFPVILPMMKERKKPTKSLPLSKLPNSKVVFKPITFPKTKSMLKNKSKSQWFLTWRRLMQTTFMRPHNGPP